MLGWFSACKLLEFATVIASWRLLGDFVSFALEVGCSSSNTSAANVSTTSYSYAVCALSCYLDSYALSWVAAGYHGWVSDADTVNWIGISNANAYAMYRFFYCPLSWWPNALATDRDAGWSLPGLSWCRFLLMGWGYHMVRCPLVDHLGSGTLGIFVLERSSNRVPNRSTSHWLVLLSLSLSWHLKSTLCPKIIRRL